MSFNFPFILSFVFLWFMKSGFCIYCGLYISCPEVFTYEHLVPDSKGGNGSKLNKKPCCKYCNVWRGNKDLSKWKIEVEKIIHSKTKKRKPGRGIQYWNNQDLHAIVENIEHWQNYILDKGDALLRQRVAMQNKFRKAKFIFLNADGWGYCDVCKTRGFKWHHNHTYAT